MLSVLKHASIPVKFWFLKNFLSPTIKVGLNGRSFAVKKTFFCDIRLFYRLWLNSTVLNMNSLNTSGLIGYTVRQKNSDSFGGKKTARKSTRFSSEFI